MSIAERLQKAREKLDLTQEAAAPRWGVNLRTLQGWERGQHEPRGFARTQLEKLLTDILGPDAPRATNRRGKRGGDPVH